MTLPNGFNVGDRIKSSTYNWYDTGTVVDAATAREHGSLASVDSDDQVYAMWDGVERGGVKSVGYMPTRDCKLLNEGNNVTPVLNETTVTDLVTGLLAQGLDADIIRAQVNEALESKREYWEGFAAGREAAKQELTAGYQTDELRKVHQVYYGGVYRDVTLIGMKKSATWRPLLLVLEHARAGVLHDEPQVKSFKVEDLEYRKDVTQDYA